jgi:hypothetical protein
MTDANAVPVSELLFVVGLPGSGKSPRLKQLEAQGWHIYDDYKASAYADDPHFCAARRYPELIENLQKGCKCVVADIAFCRTQDREQAVRILHSAFPDLTPQWEFFENNEKQCLINLQGSNGPSSPRIAKLNEIAPQYRPPVGENIVPVWR